jgi:hypothetical protein
VTLRCAPASAALVALLVPATAASHIRAGIVAVDDVATADPLPQRLRDALAVEVDRSHRALRLAMRPGHSAVVLGAHGEPLLRLGPGRSSGVWHDARTSAARWTIPIRLDGRPARLVGTTRRAPPPARWPWLVLAGALVTPVLLLFAGRASARIATGLAVAAGAATAIVALAFALAAYGSLGTKLTSLDELVILAAAMAVAVGGRGPARAGGLMAVGIVGVFAGGLKSAALLHGVVLTDVPADVVRAAVVTAIASGTAVLAYACALFYRLSAPGW